MKALLYLLRKTIQNALRELVKKPVTLIPYLVIAGLLIFSATMTSGEPAGEVRNLNAYAAIVNGVFLLIFCTSLLQGLKQGMALFSMADVNLLFTAPVNPRKILIYGVVRQAGILVLASVCMLAPVSYTHLSVLAVYYTVCPYRKKGSVKNFSHFGFQTLA